MACGEAGDIAEWMHVKSCALDSCKATSELQDWSSLTKYVLLILCILTIKDIFSIN